MTTTTVVHLIRNRPVLFKLMFWYRLYLNRGILPPPELNFVGYPEFKKIGRQYLDYIKTFTGLEPDQSVLDIGCGIGRTAIPMTEYLNAAGRYEGFDIVDLGITWCARKITPRYPNFQFQKADVYNDHYNPTGRITAEAYRFPYEDETFDVAYATSVFTHMLPEAVSRYINEMQRVLKPGGRALCTFFVLDQHSMQYMDTSSFPFKVLQEGYGVMNEECPENAIAYSEEHIRSVYSDAGLAIIDPIRFGSWSGRPDSTVGGQDMVVSYKPERFGTVELGEFEK